MVVAVLDDYRGKIEVAPDYEGWMVGPTDQRVHSIEKRYYYHFLAPLGRYITPIEKYEAWRRAVFEVSAQDIAACWKSNGLIGDLSDEEIVKVAHKLFTEGQHLTKEYKEVHCQQLLAYLQWRKQHGFDFDELKNALTLLEGTSYFDTIKSFLSSVGE
jgi:hypothetical protein